MLMVGQRRDEPSAHQAAEQQQQQEQQHQEPRQEQPCANTDDKLGVDHKSPLPTEVGQKRPREGCDAAPPAPPPPAQVSQSPQSPSPLPASSHDASQAAGPAKPRTAAVAATPPLIVRLKSAPTVKVAVAEHLPPPPKAPQSPALIAPQRPQGAGGAWVASSASTSSSLPSLSRFPATPPTTLTTRSPSSGSGSFTSPVMAIDRAATASAPRSPGSASVASATSTSVASAASASGGFVARIGKTLAEALMVGQPTERTGEAAAVAGEIAACLSLKRDASSAAKILYANLKAADNGELRDEVLSGQLRPQELVDMNPHDLVNSEVRRQREEAYRERMRDRNWVELKKSVASTTRLFVCPRCKQNDCNLLSHKQTRSGDEPMTARLQCNVCGFGFRRDA